MYKVTKRGVGETNFHGKALSIKYFEWVSLAPVM
jgi:hypothetical protein